MPFSSESFCWIWNDGPVQDVLSYEILLIWPQTHCIFTSCFHNTLFFGTLPNLKSQEMGVSKIWLSFVWKEGREHILPIFFFFPSRTFSPHFSTTFVQFCHISAISYGHPFGSSVYFESQNNEGMRVPFSTPRMNTLWQFGCVTVLSVSCKEKPWTSLTSLQVGEHCLSALLKHNSFISIAYTL